MTIKGIDVAKYQPTNPDPADTLNGISFYIAKATQGATPDPTYAAHIRNARERNIPVVGAYHFGVNASALMQVNAFLATAGNVDCYALDIEGANTMTEAQGRAFIKEMHSRGLLIGMYHSESGFPDWGQDWDWVANYSREPKRHYDIWQYGPAAPNVDGDIFQGDVPQLLNLFGVTVTPAPITDIVPATITTHAGINWYDLDGKTILFSDKPALGPRVSPFACGTKRAIYITTKGVVRLGLVVPATVNSQDCSAEIVKAINDERKTTLAAITILLKPI